MRQSGLSFCLFVLQEWPLSCFGLFPVSRLGSYRFFPFLIHRCFCIWNFYRLRHRDELMNRIVMIDRCISSACNVVFMMFGLRQFVESWDSTIQPNLVFGTFSDANNPPSRFRKLPLFMSVLLSQGIAGAMGVSSFFLAFFIVSWYSSSFGSMI